MEGNKVLDMPTVTDFHLALVRDHANIHSKNPPTPRVIQ